MSTLFASGEHLGFPRTPVNHLPQPSFVYFGRLIYQDNLHCEIRDKNVRFTRVNHKTAW